MGNDLPKFKEFRLENPQLTHARGESPTVAVRYGSSILACVAGVKRGRGGFGRAREKGKKRLQGDHCFLQNVPLFAMQT